MSKERRRIPEFYKLSVRERLEAVRERELLPADDLEALVSGGHTLDLDAADKMIENVVGVMGLPLGLGMNLRVNGKRYIVPMAVEEPSVVAALSSASKVVGEAGGFSAEATDPVLIGQIQVVNLPDIEAAKNAIKAQTQDV
ncbi:MAG: hydroxymethylglutaryl-CoA reductase, partial [Gammaproteobacteria bacterium]|nr:hydroxymethylglutaryl-CoA reductase [Gammaproteobacteria bacterium]